MSTNPLFVAPRSQVRRINLAPVVLDLPPDLAVQLGFIADKSGVPIDQLIIDLLRDSLGTPAVQTFKRAEAS